MRRTLFLIFLSMAFSGCSIISENWLPDRLMITSPDSKQSGPYAYISDGGEIMLDKIPYTPVSSKKEGETEGENEKGKNTPLNKSQFISTAIALSDEKCMRHKAQIVANTSTWNVGTGTAAILFSGTASVLSHAQTVAELSAAAAATSGIQSLVNKEVYADAMGTTIIRAIDVARAKKRAVLEKGFDDTNYSIAKAIIDLKAYHDACSLLAGLTEVSKALENRKPSQNEINLSIKHLTTALDNLITIGDKDKNIKVADQKQELLDAIQAKTLELASAKADD